MNCTNYDKNKDRDYSERDHHNRHSDQPARRDSSLARADATHKGFTSEGKNGRHFAKRLGKFQNQNRKQKDRPKAVSLWVPIGA